MNASKEQVAAHLLNADDIATIDGLTGRVVGRHNLRPHTVVAPAVHTPDKNFAAAVGPDNTQPVHTTIVVLRPLGARDTDTDKAFRLDPAAPVARDSRGAVSRAPGGLA